MKQLIIIRGIPGSGKSTLAKQLQMQIPDSLHYEADMYFVVDGEYKFDFNNLYDAHQWCRESTIRGLEANKTVIVSNTFTQLKELRPYFNIAKDQGLVPVVYLAQNQFKDVHGVPESTLTNMKARFQYDISSLYAEASSNVTK